MSTTVEIPHTPYCYESTQDPVIEQLSKRVKELRQGGKLTSEVLLRIRKYFRIKNIYHSNAIEGNMLDVGETRQVVEYGLTLTGKPLKDQAEAKNLSEALDFLESLAVNAEMPIKESDVRQIHLLVLKNIDDENAGKYRSVKVEISGSEFKPPPPESISAQMEEFGKWLSQISVVDQGNIGSRDALFCAAVAHAWLVYIHPFIDGNGRVARLLMNLILMRCGYPVAIITKEDRLRYYDALETSQASDLSPFISLLIECLHESLEEYEEAAKEQREKEEWAQSLASRFSEKEKIRAQNEFEVWKNAMELLKSYFRKTAELLSETSSVGSIFVRDFGNLEFEKYLSLRQFESAKKTWFFRIDFRSGEKVVRYLFFFGSPSYLMRSKVDVTLHISREEPPGSFHYERLETVTFDNIPGIVEIGYKADAERFIARSRGGQARMDKIDVLGKKFFEDVVRVHFQN